MTKTAMPMHLFPLRLVPRCRSGCDFVTVVAQARVSIDTSVADRAERVTTDVVLGHLSLGG